MVPPILGNCHIGTYCDDLIKLAQLNKVEPLSSVWSNDSPELTKLHHKIIEYILMVQYHILILQYGTICSRIFRLAL